MSDSNARAKFAGIFARTREAYLEMSKRMPWGTNPNEMCSERNNFSAAPTAANRSEVSSGVRRSLIGGDNEAENFQYGRAGHHRPSPSIRLRVIWTLRFVPHSHDAPSEKLPKRQPRIQSPHAVGECVNIKS